MLIVNNFLHKGKIFYIFFLFFNLYTFSYSNDNLIKSLSNSYKWKALLHIRDGKPKINNASFLLSYKDFSLENELYLTIKSFQNGKNICKYPARYYFLSEYFRNTFQKKECKAFSNYLKQTDVDSIKLVFTAGNVTDPSSMMGHVFFKLESKKEKKIVKENAVSFFTVIDTFNIPLLIAKSTFLGMKGYFILNPYQKQIYKYLYDENRSIWEYDLNLKDEEKKLLLYHFWELKDIDITYLFTGFNCATMVDDILAILKPNYKDKSFWITPKDVIKNAQKNKIIKGFKMIPALKWELNMLKDNMNESTTQRIINLVNKKEFSLLQKYILLGDKKQVSLKKYFLNVYIKYLFINSDTFGKKKFEKLQKIIGYNNDFVIDIKDYKNPINTYNDSQVNFMFLKKNENNILRLSILPASNSLYDDNREYFSENSLKIGELNLLLESNKIDVESFNLYDMKLYIPWNNITNDLSKEFNLSYKKHKSDSFKDLNVLNISGSIGISNKLSEDITFFNMMSFGLGANFEKIYPYASLKTGFTIYELYDMKSTFSFEKIYNQDNSDDTYNKITFNQSLYLPNNKDFKFDLHFDRKYKKNQNDKSIGFNITYYL